MLPVLENEIALCKWSVGTAQFRTLEAAAGPDSHFRPGYFSGSQFHNGCAAVKRDDALHCCDKTMDDRMTLYREQ